MFSNFINEHWIYHDGIEGHCGWQYCFIDCLDFSYGLFYIWSKDSVKRILNYLLAISFVLTIMVPITGIIVHKLASTLFLVLALIHVFLYRKRLDLKYILIIVLTIVSFILGILGLIMVEYPMILILHRTVSIVLIILLAIHIYKFHRRLAVA